MDIRNAPLHDATLKRLELIWAESTCVLHLAISDYPEYELRFSGVSEVVVPKKEPWGASVSVNSATDLGNGIYEVEMQTGDVIRIVASNVMFDANPQAGRSA